MRPKEVSDKLQLEKIAKDHVWKVEPSCATTGEGIFEGLVWTFQAHEKTLANISFRHGSATTSSSPKAASKASMPTLRYPPSPYTTACARTSAYTRFSV